jgi:hypothetical protein
MRFAASMNPQTTNTPAIAVSGDIGEYVVFFVTGMVVSGSAPVTGTLAVI